MHGVTMKSFMDLQQSLSDRKSDRYYV